MELNKVSIVSKTGRNAAVAAMESQGFNALRSGLGVAPGNYKFVTPNNENIYGTKAVKSAKGSFGLTLVAGTLVGADEANKSVSNTYGVGDADKQFIVTLDQFNAIEPDQTYSVTVGANGRISKLELASSEISSEETLETV